MMSTGYDSFLLQHPQVLQGSMRGEQAGGALTMAGTVHTDSALLGTVIYRCQA